MKHIWYGRNPSLESGHLLFPRLFSFNHLLCSPLPYTTKTVHFHTNNQTPLFSKTASDKTLNFSAPFALVPSGEGNLVDSLVPKIIYKKKYPRIAQRNNLLRSTGGANQQVYNGTSSKLWYLLAGDCQREKTSLPSRTNIIPCRERCKRFCVLCNKHYTACFTNINHLNSQDCKKTFTFYKLIKNLRDV